MDLRQLRSLVALVESKFSVTRTAASLYLVQSAVSQQIARLEEELGLMLLVRQGKRVLGLTEAGEQVYRYAEQILATAHNIYDVSEEVRHKEQGVLRIGATHTQARYLLPSVLKAFNAQYPKVDIQIHQSTPSSLVDMVLGDQVDVAICTDMQSGREELIHYPCYQWNRVLIMPSGHPLAAMSKVTLERLCDYPIITYVEGFSGRSKLDQVLGDAGLSPHIFLSAADTDVIKTYVADGMGIGIIACMAYDKQLDVDFECRDLGHLFPWETTKIACRKGRYIRAFQSDFITHFQEAVGQLSERLGIRVVGR